MTASTLDELREVTAWDGALVAAFDRGREDILVVERPPLPGIEDAIATARVHGCKYVVTSGGRCAAEAIRALNFDCPALAEDVEALARSFLDQFGAAEASLRVEVVDKRSCPKFHCTTFASGWSSPITARRRSSSAPTPRREFNSRRCSRWSSSRATSTRPMPTPSTIARRPCRRVASGCA